MSVPRAARLDAGKPRRAGCRSEANAPSVIALWVPITLSAALFQTWRTALQQQLRGRYSVGTAAFVRFVYAIPVGSMLLVTYVVATRAVLPPLDAGFVLGCAAGGIAQIFGTSLLIMAFGHRNFAVGTAYSKTDAVQAAIVSWIVLSEALAPLAWVGVAVGVCGVLVLSLAGRGLRPASASARDGSAGGAVRDRRRHRVRARRSGDQGGDAGARDIGQDPRRADGAGADQRHAKPVAGGLDGLARAGRAESRFHRLAQRRLGGGALRLRLRLLVCGVCAGARRAGADIGAGRGGLHPPFQPILPA